MIVIVNVPDALPWSKQVANPPLYAVVAGILVGLSPLGTVLFHPSSPAALVSHIEFKLNHYLYSSHCW